jgi:transcriptional regulator with XRE-family HTH domain
MAAFESLLSVWCAYLTMVRVQKGMTQRGLAELSGIAQNQIAKWECGGEPSLRNLVRWSDALGFDVQLVRREVA